MSRRCPQCGTSFPDAVFFCGMDGTITIQEQDPSDVDQRLGTQLGGYIVVARVADGAMGRVYEGRHPETKARVAIKVLHPQVAQDGVAVERFKREYETANEFDHPHIVKVLEFDPTQDGSWFLTMEYLEGEELGELLRRDGAMPLDRIVRVITQAAMGIDEAHSYGVIHRDLKPDNIFLCRSEEGDSVRLLDFGSVKLQMETGPKLTAFGTTLGSPYYMSPEQAMGKQDVDQRTDVFALSAILYEMLTGKIAFEGDNVAEILMKIVNEATPLASAINPMVPPAIDQVIDHGCRKQKTERFDDALSLAEAACRALGLAEGSAEELSRVPQTELAQRLAYVTAVDSHPFGDAPPVAAPSPPADTHGGQLGAPPSSMAPVRRSNTGLLIAVGLGVFGLLAVAGMLVVALFMT